MSLLKPKIRFASHGARLTDELASIVDTAHKDDPLRQITIVAPSAITCHYLQSAVTARIPRGLFAVEFQTPKTIIDAYASPVASEPRLTATMRFGIIHELADRVSGMFESAKQSPYFVSTLQKTFAELDLLSPNQLKQLKKTSGIMPPIVALYDKFNKARGRFKTEAEIATLATQKAGSFKLGHLVLVVSEPPLPCQRKFISALVKHAQTVLISQSGADSPLDKQLRDFVGEVGDLRPTHSSDTATNPTPTTNFCYADSPRLEAQGLVRNIVAELRRGIPLNRIAVVCPNKQTAIVVSTALNLSGLNNCGYGQRGSFSDGLAQFLHALANVLENGWSNSAIRSLIAGTALKSGAAPAPTAEWLRIVTNTKLSAHKRWAYQIQNYGQACARRAEKAQNDGDIQVADYLRQLSSQSDGLIEFIQKFSQRLSIPDGVGWKGYVDWLESLVEDFCREVSGSHLNNTLGSLRDLDELGLGNPSPRRMAQVLRSIVGETPRPKPQLGSGVLVVLLGDFVEGDFEAAHFMGMSEGMFPAGQKPNPFFPEHFKHEIVASSMLPDRKLYAQHLRDSFERIYGAVARRSCYWSGGRNDTRGTHYPCAWLTDKLFAEHHAATGLNLSAWLNNGMVNRVEPFNSPNNIPEQVAADSYELELMLLARGMSPAHKVAQRATILHQRNAGAWGVYDGELGAKSITLKVRSASGFNQLQSCPFKFFLSSELGLPGLEDIELPLELPPRDLGNLVHRILERFVSANPNGQRNRFEQDAIELTRIAKREFARASAIQNIGIDGLVRMAQEYVLLELYNWLRAHRGLHDSGWNTAYTEYGFGNSDDPIPNFEIGGVRFRGKIDRLDTKQNGSQIAVYDYKTGAGNQKKDLQLGIYAAVARVMFPQANSIGTANWRLVGGSGTPTLSQKDLAGDLKLRVRQLGKMLEEGVFPARPKSCKTCDFDKLCPTKVQRDLRWDKIEQDSVWGAAFK